MCVVPLYTLSFCVRCSSVRVVAPLCVLFLFFSFVQITQKNFCLFCTKLILCNLHKNEILCFAQNLSTLLKIFVQGVQKKFRLCRPITKITNDVNDFLCSLHKKFFVYFAQNYFCAICTNLGIVHHAQKSLTLLIVFVHPAQKKFSALPILFYTERLHVHYTTSWFICQGFLQKK